MREGLGTKKHNKCLSERPNKQQEREKRFVSSLEVSNVFQYNALQTIIQLQSLILFIQTSWNTYTVLLLSLRFNKTKYEIIATVQLFLSEEGNRTSQSPYHDLGVGQWKLQYGYWRWPVSSSVRHTYLSNIYNSANFPDQSKEKQKQLVWLHQLILEVIRVEIRDGEFY